MLLIWSSRPVVLPSTLDTVFGLSKDIKNTGMYESQPVNVVYKHVRVCDMFLMFFALFTYLHPFSCHMQCWRLLWLEMGPWQQQWQLRVPPCRWQRAQTTFCRFCNLSCIMESSWNHHGIMDHCSHLFTNSRPSVS